MNGNAYNAGGAPAARPASYFTDQPGTKPTRTKVTFDPPRVPVILKPESIPTRTVDGKFGPQYQWFFEGNQVAWFDPDVHEEIKACIVVSDCTEVAITKHVRRGQQPRYEVQGVADETRHAPEMSGSATPLRESSGSATPLRESRDQLAARRIDEVKKQNSQARPPRTGYEAPDERETAPLKNAMSHALIEAITAASEVVAIAHANAIEWKPSSEDIRALAITIYIHEAKR